MLATYRKALECKFFLILENLIDFYKVLRGRKDFENIVFCFVELLGLL